MKRRDLVRYLESNGCRLLREGGRHSIYYNQNNRRTTAVPRHNEIGERLARKICSDVEIPQPQ